MKFFICFVAVLLRYLLRIKEKNIIERTDFYRY